MRPVARAGSGSTVAPVVALVAVTAVWGSTFVLVSKVIATMPVFSFLAWRFGLATLLLLVLRPKSLALLSRVEVRRAVIIGVALGLGYIMQTAGLLTVAPSVSGFITGMFLIFTPLVAWVVNREPVPAMAWWAVVVGTVGLGVMSLQGLSVSPGVLLSVGGALMYAVQIVLLSTWSTAATAYPLAIVQLGVVTVMAAAVMPFEKGPHVPPTPQVWAAVLFLAFIATALAFVVQTRAQARLEPTRAAVVLTLEPVFAGVTGFLVGDPITMRLILGGALVLVAMYLVELGPRQGREATVAHLER